MAGFRIHYKGPGGILKIAGGNAGAGSDHRSHARPGEFGAHFERPRQVIRQHEYPVVCHIGPRFPMPAIVRRQGGFLGDRFTAPGLSFEPLDVRMALRLRVAPRGGGRLKKPFQCGIERK